MKKKWATWLSLLVLCLSIVANISQGYTVLADSLASDESMLIQDADPFNYIKNGDVAYPKQRTLTYQNGKTDEDIVNYDFSQSSSEGQSSIKNIFGSGALTFDNGYHYYQNDGYVKKIVMPTNDPTQFNVRLDMIGEELKTTKPVDIAMVLDASSSMNFRMQDNYKPVGNEKSRWQTMKDSIAYFANQLIGPSSNNNDNVRIGFTSFGSAVESGDSVPFTKIGKFSSNHLLPLTMISY
jgi:hypothetical protein